MTTYTIAYCELLYACVPDGDDEALERELRDAGEQRSGDDGVEPIRLDTVSIETGLILTDDKPDDASRIVWRGQDLGWLTDEHGKSYDYAIRAD